ncbi:MAG TPA: hypothetical protein PKA88_30025 [Polyangiaceae bacterium]|nr:hypothetical protein [Polyangiaceae bacterium]
MTKLDKWTTLCAAALVVGALFACKKEEPPPPIESAAPAPEPPKEEPKKEEPKKEDEVKRYGDKEKEEKGTVKVTVFSAKIYKEADDTTDHIATLSRGTLVNRKARMGNWVLIDYPSGVGVLSPAWIFSKHLSTIVEKVDVDAVLKQDAGVVIVDAGQPKVDASVAKVDAGTPKVDAAVAAQPDAAVVVKPDAATKGRLKLPFKVPGK